MQRCFPLKRCLLLAVIPTMASQSFSKVNRIFDKYLIVEEFGGITDEEQFKALTSGLR